MDAVLNRTTETVHKPATDRLLGASCGATRGLDEERLERTSLELARSRHDASKCGRCFDDGGGY